MNDAEKWLPKDSAKQLSIYFGYAGGLSAFIYLISKLFGIY